MRFLFEKEGIDFDNATAAIAEFFGRGHIATIHDGDGSILLGCLPGHYCAGTVADPRGVIVASFAIDYLMSDTEEDPSQREVVAVHIGPPGHWCRSESDYDRYNCWVADLAAEYDTSANDINRSRA